MTDWFKWISNLVWQPAKDERLTLVEKEVAGLREAYDGLKTRTEALEAFHRLADGGKR